MICPKCGANIDDNAAFCPNCGEVAKGMIKKQGLKLWQKIGIGFLVFFLLQLIAIIVLVAVTLFGSGGFSFEVVSY